MDDGILVVESWLMSATDYIAIDSTTSARNSCRRKVRNGPTRSIGWSRQAQESTTIVLLITANNKHCFILDAHVALGAVAKVSWVIPCVLSEYINHVSLA